MTALRLRICLLACFNLKIICTYLALRIFSLFVDLFAKNTILLWEIYASDGITQNVEALFTTFYCLQLTFETVEETSVGYAVATLQERQNIYTY